MGELFAGRYELADPIGRGGVGEVWRAWDHRRGRYVAAKVLQQSDAHALLRFVREQALRIDHPHVLAPTGWAADDDKVLFTMDLVRGGSLAHLISHYGALPPRLVCTLLDQLLAGLTAVHGEQVVHRDIKPANLLLEATGTARPHLRLSDFGISVRLGDARLTETHLVVGTPGYFAPEQLLGADPDFPQDLYAVGLVAMFMLTGTRPDAETLSASYVSGGFPAAPEGVPHALWQLVASLLNPNPDARFRTAIGARKALTAAWELLPDPPTDAADGVDIPDQLGPPPPGFGPRGPARPPAGATAPTDPRAAGRGPIPGPAVGQPPTPQPAEPSTPTPTVASTSGDDFPLAAPRTPPEPLPEVVPPRALAGVPTVTRPGPTRPTAVSSLPEGDPGSDVPPTDRDDDRERVLVRRPGPPRTVVVPVLLLAAACFAVGFWALLTG
ncbi:serine/threonine protein kinase [Wenjunlia vitaminophila]|uniref:non-specific serine/threonine protein kinase n=1 Tax=Wenjunlia vitaminophila TaxID=76728 RepID=A0A0T6LN76_WENVI|nr:serine/threonine-protein kinase [Wenjunlia vitaminophila]KRV47329.1 serine/threonine protein kinase [Wenjunlia vitaminophila]